MLEHCHIDRAGNSEFKFHHYISNRNAFSLPNCSVDRESWNLQQIHLHSIWNAFAIWPSARSFLQQHGTNSYCYLAAIHSFGRLQSRFTRFPAMATNINNALHSNNRVLYWHDSGARTARFALLQLWASRCWAFPSHLISLAASWLLSELPVYLQFPRLHESSSLYLDHLLAASDSIRDALLEPNALNQQFRLKYIFLLRGLDTENKGILLKPW